MELTTKRLSTRVSIAALLAVAVGQGIGLADVVQSTVALPPPGGSYTFGPLCISALSRCVEDTVISDFVTTSTTEVAGNEVVDATAQYTANVYTDNSGVPGTFVGVLSMSGPFDVTYVGRTSLTPLGTFSTQVTSFDFSGMLNGNTFQVIQNPSLPSTGTTTILESTFTPPIEYTVSSSINFNGEYNFNSMGFVPAPTRSGTLTPDPGSGALVSCILIGALGIASRRRVRVK